MESLKTEVGDYVSKQIKISQYNNFVDKIIWHTDNRVETYREIEWREMESM